MQVQLDEEQRHTEKLTRVLEDKSATLVSVQQRCVEAERTSADRANQIETLEERIKLLMDGSNAITDSISRAIQLEVSPCVFVICSSGVSRRALRRISWVVSRTCKMIMILF
jgi:tRNA-dihydrouridine synthase